MKVGTQIGLGLLLAGIGIAVLQWYVAVSAGQPARDLVSDPPPVDRASPADGAAAGRDVLADLPGVALTFHLAAVRDALPAGCAPVLRVRKGGAIIVSVAPPLVMRPGPMVWERVGVLLPQARIADLSAAERSSLIAIWSRLRGSGALTPDRIRVHGCHFRVGELAVLLRWLR